MNEHKYKKKAIRKSLQNKPKNEQDSLVWIRSNVLHVK